jgi:hypothetical protein
VVGLLFLAVCLALEKLILGLAQGPFGAIVATGFTIVGWVAMWRPLEIYLYNWWPVREERRNYERLACMAVRLVPPA